MNNPQENQTVNAVLLDNDQANISKNSKRQKFKNGLLNIINLISNKLKLSNSVYFK